MPEGTKVSAIWHRRIGDKIQVLAEIDGRWHLISEEKLSNLVVGELSEIVEATCFRSRPEVEEPRNHRITRE